jgi:hypothetical protein
MYVISAQGNKLKTANNTQYYSHIGNNRHCTFYTFKKSANIYFYVKKIISSCTTAFLVRDTSTGYTCGIQVRRQPDTDHPTHGQPDFDQISFKNFQFKLL